MIFNKRVNKKGWIKIFEALIAILVIAGVVFIAINQSQEEKGSIFLRIHNDQITILRDIQLDNSLRTEIIGTFGTVEWVDFPTQTKARIIAKTPNYLMCEGKICASDNLCLPLNSEEKDIYAESIIISATNTEYNPRQLKLFCWEK